MIKMFEELSDSLGEGNVGKIEPTNPLEYVMQGPALKYLQGRGYNLTSPKPLGSGRNGTAYALSSGQVMKITKDASEAKSSANVAGRGPRFVNDIYDVMMKNIQGRTYFFIFQEQLRPLSSDEIRLFEETQNILHRIGIWENFINGEFLGFDYTAWELQHFLGNTNHPIGQDPKDILKTATWFENVFMELEEMGISGWEDLHKNNVMKDDYGWKVIDLGYSNPRGGGDKIDTLPESRKIPGVGLLIESFRKFAGREEGFSSEEIEGELDKRGIERGAYNIDQLSAGARVEMEHGTRLDNMGDTNVTDDELWPTLQIVLAHLKENPNYYTHLGKMEDGLVREGIPRDNKNNQKLGKKAVFHLIHIDSGEVVGIYRTTKSIPISYPRGYKLIRVK